MKPRAITERQIYEARVMHRKLGWSYAKIGKVFGVNPSTIRFHLNKDQPLPSSELARRMFNSARSSVRDGRVSHLGRGFNAEALETLLEDQGFCAITGNIFDATPGSFYLPSCDRVDHQGAYTLDNIQLVGTVVNRARQSLSVEDFLHLCRDVVHQQDHGVSRWLSEALDRANS